MGFLSSGEYQNGDAKNDVKNDDEREMMALNGGASARNELSGLSEHEMNESGSERNGSGGSERNAIEVGGIERWWPSRLLH